MRIKPSRESLWIRVSKGEYADFGVASIIFATFISSIVVVEQVMVALAQRYTFEFMLADVRDLTANVTSAFLQPIAIPNYLPKLVR